ncbi:MAG TPA: nicotinate phosphoribosyltransferase [Geobacterales bacterium]|nr:nicotinate phosphoribosyltransferase [Geobacterales bacterium]
MSRKFFIATEEEILEGKVTDIYYIRTYQVLEKKGKLDIEVTMDVHSYSFPKNYEWAVFCGLNEVLNLFIGKNVDVYAMDEGTIFRLYEPVFSIKGPYREFGVYEPIIDGILRQYVSIATRAARIKLAAGDKTVIFFGIRSIHPALAPLADRAAYIGGCDAVSGVLGSELLKIQPVGTMPHELTLIFDKVEEAWKSFDEVMPQEVPRYLLCDTMYDERTEVWLAAKTLGKRLAGVRLDTPSSRRGDIRKLLQEIRWILDINGLKDAKIILSSGVDEDTITLTRDLVDIYGVGTAIAFPPSVDLAFDIVEKEGVPYSKRSKLPGRKQVYRCLSCFRDEIKLFTDPAPEKCKYCGGEVEPLLKKFIEKGKLIRELQGEKEVKKYVLEQLNRIAKS